MDVIMIGVLVSSFNDYLNFNTCLTITNNQRQIKAFEKYIDHGEITFSLAVLLYLLGMLKFVYMSLISIIAYYHNR
jgi:hypothetical protein